MSDPADTATAAAAAAAAAADADATKQAPEQPGSILQGHGSRVIVLKRKKKRNKKKKYTKGSKEVQRLGEGVTRASARVARAVGVGMTTFDKRSKRSSKKRKDGALVDIVENSARGVSKTFKKASGAPEDLAKKIKLKRLRKPTRSLLRAARPFMLIR